MIWDFIIGLLIGLAVFSPFVLRRRGYTVRGRYETSTHLCRPPRWTHRLPDGTRWRCRKCGMSWTMDTHGSRFRCRKCRLDWVHDYRPIPDPGPWGTTTKRIAELERELGLMDEGES